MMEGKFKNEWHIAFSGKLPEINIPTYDPGQNVATRKVWGPFIEELAKHHPTLVGGSADLEPSNVTAGFAKLVGDFTTENRLGRNLSYGVREFPMGAINNGIAQHGGLKVFGATFFVFSDYERPAIRLRAIQGLPVVSEYTHDSIFVGEDGPTHQPIEHLMACRAIPNLLVLRPADANEAIIAGKWYLNSQTVLHWCSLPVRDCRYLIGQNILQLKKCLKVAILCLIARVIQM
jgi:transketolase